MTKLIFHKRIVRQAAFIFSCFFFFSCENDPRTIAELTNSRTMVEEAKNIETFLSQGGRIRAKLWAPYMLRYQADTAYVEFSKTLHVNFFNSAGKVESHLDALYGKYYENLNKV